MLASGHKIKTHAQKGELTCLRSHSVAGIEWVEGTVE